MAAYVSAVDSPVSPNISALPAIVSLTIKLDMQIKLDAHIEELPCTVSSLL